MPIHVILQRLLTAGLFGLVSMVSAAAELVFLPTDAPEILYSGRRSEEGQGRVHLSYSGGRVRLAIRGESVSARLHATHRGNFINVYVNGVRTRKLELGLELETVVLAEGLDPQKVHTVEMVKATEGFAGEMVLSGFELSPGSVPQPWPGADRGRILFIGDSIICGYGIEASGADEPFRNEEQNFCLSFAGLTARALGADYEVVARSGIGLYRNYNGPREGNAETLPTLFDRVHFRRALPLWDFERFTPDLISINLGTNDFSTQGADVERFVEAGERFLRRLRALYPSARVVLVSGPMQHSAAYKQALRDMLERGEIPEAERAIFTLSPQGQLGFGAHWHPSARQAERNAQELSAFLREWMGW